MYARWPHFFVQRYFLLSPANSGGKRAAMLLRPEAAFPLAAQLNTTGAPIGEIYSFISGLYFRGKAAYASRFAAGTARVIVAGRGLLEPSVIVSRDELIDIGAIPVDPAEPRYLEPLLRDARALGPSEVVLLGSIATPKYFDPLCEVFGERLLFPSDFVGRGDMSRGGLMLRCARAGTELDYIPAITAVRRGRRPPKLPKP
jgi:hypothetical protein